MEIVKLFEDNLILLYKDVILEFRLALGDICKIELNKSKGKFIIFVKDKKYYEKKISFDIDLINDIPYEITSAIEKAEGRKDIIDELMILLNDLDWVFRVVIEVLKSEDKSEDIILLENFEKEELECFYDISKYLQEIGEKYPKFKEYLDE